MKKKSLKILTSVVVGTTLSFTFSTFIYMNANATVVNVVNQNIWSKDKEYKANKYFEDLTEDRDRELIKVLNVANIKDYTDDMKSLYELSLLYDKVEEVEKIMTDYEKNQVYYELLILTGDEDLAKEYRDDENFNFKFERVV